MNLQYSTPIIKADKLRQALGADFEIYLKREDLSPYGSHKGRSIPAMIKYYLEKGRVKKFAISSSGNAALAAAIFVHEYNITGDEKITLHIFVGQNIPWYKYRRLKKIVKRDKNIILEKNSKPKQAAFLLAKEKQYQNLRQSTDDLALLGYEDLARELHGEVKNLNAIFIPTSSATTAVGMYRGLQKIKNNARVFFIQTSFCHPFISDEKQSKSSIASAIVDVVGHRKKEVAEIVAHHGRGYIAENKDIKTAIKILKKTEKIKISPNSALAIVGLTKAIEEKQNISGAAVCLMTGE